MMRLLLPAIFCLFHLCSFAQHSIEGTITDATTGAPVSGAHVVAEPPGKAAVTDTSGYFSIGDLSGEITLKVTFLGYRTHTETVNVASNQNINIKIEQYAILTDEVLISATRATATTPTTFTEVSKEEIQEQNFGQDVPYIVQFTPSVVTTSDAGTGVGYTGLRIRGSDQTRINVTINGIPVNDAESHGVWWVNMPDIASSVDNIQIQRGVGTSTHGAGAFGGTINFQTLGVEEKPHAEINQSYGSFNTRKHTFMGGTGLINDRFSFNGRYSRLHSDGYIDRAFTDLTSYYFSGGFHGKNTMIKAVLFSGQEQTYQAWYGVPQELLDDNRTFNEAGMQRPNAPYDNETDNYQQDHYQLHFSQNAGMNWQLNLSGHYTKGQGFYEQYKAGRRLSNYGIPDVILDDTVITRTDLIQRKWLDNDFYGITWSARYQMGNRLSWITGGAANRYDGTHFGEVIWARYAGGSEIRQEFYNNKGVKDDVNVFTKATFALTNSLSLFGDLQYRMVMYSIDGLDEGFVKLNLDEQLNFFNPKAGLTYRLNPQNSFYGSLSIGNREPVRSDYLDAPGGIHPQPETLRNLEAGWRNKGSKHGFEVNYYLMDYRNQLVLTGELNEVGTPIRTNVDRSYRTGVELQGNIRPVKFLEWQGNFTYSINKISEFNEFMYVYDENFDLAEVNVVQHQNTNISFSPSVIASSQLTFRHKPRKRYTTNPGLDELEVALQSKFVGQQYLDNTSSEERMIPSYMVHNLRLQFTFSSRYVREFGIGLMVNNLFNRMYVDNGYTYGWIEEQNNNRARVDVNYFYPQAGRHLLANVFVRF